MTTSLPPNGAPVGPPDPPRYAPATSPLAPPAASSGAAPVPPPPPVPAEAPADAPTVSRWGGIARTVVFDIAGPLVAYQVLRNHGMSEVVALTLSGILPAIGVLISATLHRRLDIIGVMVLLGTAAAVGIAVATDDAKLVLLEGAIPTALLALACLVSLGMRRPLMFRFAEASMGGPDTKPGFEFNAKYEAYPGMRTYFRNVTIVWGVAFLLEAAAKVWITQTFSTGFALSFSRIVPYVLAGVLAVWMIIYGRRSQRKGRERAEAQARAHQAALRPS